MATYVFTHGACQGGWVWERVASILRWNKHAVHSPTLTGCGERSHLLKQGIDLHTYIRDITNFFYFESLTNVILVCHGYSGMPSSAVIQAMPHVAGKVIYLDAVVPERGKSFLDLAGEGFGYVLSSHLHDGWLVKPWPSLSFGISRSSDEQWFKSRLVDFPLAAFTTPFPGEFDSSLFDVSFIRCRSVSETMSQEMLRGVRRNRWSYHELETGPLPMITAPEPLADLLMSIGG